MILGVKVLEPVVQVAECVIIAGTEYVKAKEQEKREMEEREKQELYEKE